MSDSKSGRVKESQGQATNEMIGDAIRQLRNEVGLTQVQFAAELGVTPTTIYRYEAATNTPTNDILARVLQFAVKKQSLVAIQSLAEILGLRTGLNLLSRGVEDDDSPLLRAIASLGLEQRMLMLAAILLLRENSDETAIRVLESLLQPWVSKAHQTFGPLDLGLKADTSSIGKDLARPKRKLEK